MLKEHFVLQQTTKTTIAIKTTRLSIAIVCLFSVLAYNHTIIAQSPLKNDNKSNIEASISTFCVPIPGDSSRAHEQQLDNKSDKRSGKWRAFRSVWKRWYNFRQLLYSCDLGIQFLTGGDITPLDNARKKCLGNPSEVPFMSIRLCTGILDAALAGKPTEELVRDDVIDLTTYLICLHAYNKTVNRIKDQVLQISAITFTTQAASAVIRKLVSPVLPQNYSLDGPYKVAGFMLKHKLIHSMSTIISRPVGYIAYKSIQQYKKYKARKNNKPVIQSTNIITSQKTQKQPPTAQKTDNAQELSNNTTIPVVPVAT